MWFKMSATELIDKGVYTKQRSILTLRLYA